MAFVEKQLQLKKSVVFAPVTPTAEDVSRPSDMSSSSKQLEFQGSMLQVDPTNKRGAIIVGVDESSGSSERESEQIPTCSSKHA